RLRLRLRRGSQGGQEEEVVAAVKAEVEGNATQGSQAAMLLLERALSILSDAQEVLLYSFNKCSRIGLKAQYEPEELESFESFTGRFARLSDILIQKVFRLVDELD